MTIQQFIETAIEGGWTNYKDYENNSIADKKDLDSYKEVIIRSYLMRHCEVFLNPKAWEAVGKVKGWEHLKMAMYDITQEDDRWGYKVTEKPLWKWHMQKMIQVLCEGKTLEEYIATL